MTDNRIRALVEYIGTALPPDRSHWPAGWPREAEAALLDAIFAARATYGTPTSGVRRVVANWRAHRKHELDDLGALAAFADARTTSRKSSTTGSECRATTPPRPRRRPSRRRH